MKASLQAQALDFAESLVDWHLQRHLSRSETISGLLAISMKRNLLLIVCFLTLLSNVAVAEKTPKAVQAGVDDILKRYAMPCPVVLQRSLKMEK
jgi:hypothetical protein